MARLAWLCGMSAFVVTSYFAFLWATLIFRGNQKAWPVTFEERTYPRKANPDKSEDTLAAELRFFKELYFKLQNLESFYDCILPKAASVLRGLFSEALNSAVRRENAGILSLDVFSQESLQQFLSDEHDTCMQTWEDYNLRRRAGGGRELFKSREDAADSIRRLAPLKLVDGAWLSHVNKVSTPFVLRELTKKAWQILSEELGDGDLRKNHVKVYSDLIAETNTACSQPHSRSFIEPQHSMDDLQIWKAAVAQQLLSVFPEQFMPEILGFNMHYEGVAYETLATAYELEELGFNPSYHLLHISIDNPHSGHSAIALEIVVEYLGRLKQELEPEHFQILWDRVRAGYILSQYLNATTSQLQGSAHEDLSTRGKKVVDIFARKSRAAQKMHCRSHVTIGEYHIDEWLSKGRLREHESQRDFLQHLSNKSGLIRRGCSVSSKLVKEISWGGKMFGSFTDLERTAICQWIDALPSDNGKRYQSLARVYTDEAACDPAKDGKNWTDAFYQETPLVEQALRDADDSIFPFKGNPKYQEASNFPSLSKMLPLWFAGLSLLENVVTIPSKVANSRSCALLRVLRAQHGFSVESEGVGGLDEARRTDKVDLIGIALDWMNRAGLEIPQRIESILQHPEASFAQELIALSVRPETHADALVGFSCAFAELHEMLVPFTSPSIQDMLKEIIARERLGLEEWLDDLRDTAADTSVLCKAYSVGKQKIAECFR